MAYPAHPLPTFAEFKTKLAEDYNVEYIEGCQIQKDGSDDPHSVWYFKRHIDGEDRTYVFHNPGDEVLVSYYSIRSICKHFDIDVAKDGLYGLVLG